MVSLWDERNQRNYDAAVDWFGDVHKNPLAQDTPRAMYLRQFIPIVSGIDRASYNWEQANRYLAMYGLTWDDIDPMKMAGRFNLSGYGQVLNLSKNILRLYRRCRLGVGA